MFHALCLSFPRDCLYDLHFYKALTYKRSGEFRSTYITVHNLQLNPEISKFWTDCKYPCATRKGTICESVCVLTLTPAALRSRCQVSIYLQRNYKLFCQVTLRQVLDILLPKHTSKPLCTHTGRSKLCFTIKACTHTK